MNAIATQTTMNSKKEIVTEINIDAPYQRVWEILTDFNNYHSWNPFIVQSEGKAELGSSLTNHMKLGEKINVFSPKITLVEEGRHFEWLGKGPLGSFNGNHYFILEPTGAQSCKLIHGERFSGWLRGMIMGQIGDATHEQFKNMNLALKELAEQG